MIRIIKEASDYTDCLRLHRFCRRCLICVICLLICVIIKLDFFRVVIPLCLAEAEETFVYNPKDKGDPFVPLVSKEGILLRRFQVISGEGVMLEGILWDPEGKASRAIIDGEIRKEGEEFGGVKVLKIEQDRVWLLIGQKESVFKLFSEETK